MASTSRARRAAVAVIAMTSLAACSADDRSAPAPPAPSVSTATPGSTAGSADPTATGAVSSPAHDAAGPAVGAAPPSSERLFTARLGADEPQALLGVVRGTLWAADLDAEGRPRVRWTRRGRGVVHAVAAGDAGDGYALWIAWGAGLRDREAPIVLERLDGKTGEGSTTWEAATPRAEVVSLVIVDLDADRKDDLALAYFATSHAVRARDRVAGGAVREGEPLHMATSRAFVDLDGDGRADEVVGQLYDQDPGRTGELTVKLASGAVRIPTAGGIRAVLPVQDGGPPASSPARRSPWALLVSDGWNKSYGKLARARLSLARWDGAAIAVEPVGSSSRDVSFFDLSGATSPKGPVVVGRGDVTTTVFTRDGSAWSTRELPELAASKSAVLVERAGGLPLAYDARRPDQPVRVASDR